ncbi:MAG: asparagine synthase-related protein, partial [Rhodospirillales bacterium]|nr:asparagine synthase-related protein [Rhodospirillales bacterium]
NCFVFASEPQALVRAGLVGASLNPRARGELLQLQFTTGGETAFAGIHRVLPGETLEIKAGRIIGRRRSAALPEDGPAPLTKLAALAELDSRLNDAVGVHQRSDVPYGMFFSGGVDSSVLLAMMSRLNERPVIAFTAGFPGSSVHDEREHARAVARAAGADHHEVEFGEEDFWSLLPEIAAAMDDPAADYAVLPSWKLAAAARQGGLKVVLAGEGGDEVFAGYSRYRGALRPWPFRRALRRKGIFDGLGVLREMPGPWRDGIRAAEEAAKPAWTSLMAAQATDCADWLPHDLLGKLDRCLMAHGVEGRVPFLDPKLSAFAFRLPDALKVHRGNGKWLLRRWLETALPESRPFSRKRGFTVPVGEWIAARGRELGPLVAAQPGVEEICRPGAVEALFASPGARAGKAAWTLLFYALWHRTHMLGRSPAGGVFETLSPQGNL